ncbi:TPA: DUF551 domain-containing protein [Enterobacter chengduensis]|nr:DUF551 domain-containing protein [Enterobacter chengduensis]
MSTITKEQLITQAQENVAQWRDAMQHNVNTEYAAIRLLLAEIALASLEAEKIAEPVAWRRFQETPTDGGYWILYDYKPNCSGIEPLYRHAQPAPEYPETLPCPVLLEPGLRFGKGVKTSTMLAALARRSVYESDLAALSPEERAEFQAGIEDVKALIAQPVPGVPDAYVRDERGRMMLNGVCEPKIGFGAGRNACRAAMLQCAEPVSQRDELPANVIDALEKALQAMSFMGDTLNALDAVCEEDVEYVAPAFEAVREVLEGKSPVIPDGWVACSERLPEWSDDVLCATEFDGPGDWRKKVGYWHCGKWVIYGGSWTPTHWMPLPAAPQQEDK